MPLQGEAKKEANREASQRVRDKQKGMTILGVTRQGMTKSITLDTKQQAKLSMVIKALDKDVVGLDGKRVNLLTMVRYGIGGPTLDRVKYKFD